VPFVSLLSFAEKKVTKKAAEIQTARISGVLLLSFGATVVPG